MPAAVHGGRETDLLERVKTAKGKPKSVKDVSTKRRARWTPDLTPGLEVLTAYLSLVVL